MVHRWQVSPASQMPLPQQLTSPSMQMKGVGFPDSASDATDVSSSWFGPDGDGIEELADADESFGCSTMEHAPSNTTATMTSRFMKASFSGIGNSIHVSCARDRRQRSSV
jgi:hypothetical protein